MADIKRKLATIQTIDTVNDIPGADRIKMITFKSSGWKCVTGIDSNPQPGDKRIYFEVDSVLPKLDIFKFMEPYNYRVKTIKLRGQVSQGLTLPLDECLTAFNITTPVGTDDGADLTDLLGIVKYEIPETTQIGGDTKGPFPGFIEKTDEERGANFENLEEILATTDLIARTKIDGTSGTFYVMNGEFGVCSRNQELKDTEGNIFWRMARKYDIEKRLKGMGTNVALQGEIAGPGIQSNRAKLPEVQLFVFTIQLLDTYQKFTDAQLENAIQNMNAYSQEEKLQLCPLVGRVKAGTLKTIEDLATYSDGLTLIPDVPKASREGIVLRSPDGKVSMKQVSTKYLLTYSL